MKIRRNPGVVERVRLALSRQYRLATLVGAVLGAIVPFATYVVAHALPRDEPDPRWILVAGGLLFSARTVYQWGKSALGSGLKAFGFTVLLEGVMVAAEQRWLAILALVYLCGINAIATGVTLARGDIGTAEGGPGFGPGTATTDADTTGLRKRGAAPGPLKSPVPTSTRKKGALFVASVKK